MPSCAVCAVACDKVCARCDVLFYCSVEHQKQDWAKNHKHNCIEFPSVDEDLNTDELRRMSSWLKDVIRKPNTSMRQRQCKLLDLMTMTNVLHTRFVHYGAIMATFYSAIGLHMIKLGLQAIPNSNRSLEAREQVLCFAESCCPSNAAVIASCRAQMQDEKFHDMCVFVEFETISKRSVHILQKACDNMSTPSTRLVLDQTKAGIDTIARRSFRRGETILQRPKFLAASLNLCSSCYHCCRPFDSSAPKLFPCRNDCGFDYCSKECETQAFDMYHEPLCSEHVSAMLETYVADACSDKNIATFREFTGGDVNNMLALLKFAFLMVKFYGIQLKSDIPVWDMEPLCYFGPNVNPPDLPICSALIPYEPLATIPLLRPVAKRVDPAWCLRVMQYILPNAFARCPGVVIGSQRYDETSTIFLSNEATFFNHSCVPNVAWQESKCTSEIVFVADRDIAEGESLTISYISDTTASEKRKLKHVYNFVCQCEECDVNSVMQTVQSIL